MRRLFKLPFDPSSCSFNYLKKGALTKIVGVGGQICALIDPLIPVLIQRRCLSYLSFLEDPYHSSFSYHGNDFAFQAEWIIPDKRPPDDWPDRGSIVIEEFDLKYREGLPLVLKQINCGVKPGEKV